MGSEDIIFYIKRNRISFTLKEKNLLIILSSNKISDKQKFHLYQSFNFTTIFNLQIGFIDSEILLCWSISLIKLYFCFFEKSFL